MYKPSILILKPSSLGDIVHGLLVANTIKRERPKTLIHWVARDVFAPLVQACPVVDETFLFHRQAGAKAFVRLIREIRARRYEHVLDFQGLARTGLLSLCARADEKIGRSDAREGAGFCYHRRVSLPPKGRQSHAVDILAEFLPALGLPRRVAPRLPLRVPQVNPAHSPDTPPILIFPESRRPEKNWPFFPELTAALCRELPSQRIIWAGARTMPCPQADDRHNFVNLTGATTLPDLMALLARARLVIGNDSGPLHLAAALGTPTLALFGPTAPDQFRPYPGDDKQNRILRAPQGRFTELPAAVVLEKIRDILN